VIGKIEDIITYLFKLDRDKDYEIEIKEYKEKRSINANDYMWVLCNKIANKTRLSKEEVYLSMLKDYGQMDRIKIIKEANPKDYFKYFEIDFEKENYIYYKIYKGSSNFDKEEMSILIDGIVQEAQQLGIETKTPKELLELKSKWENEKA